MDAIRAHACRPDTGRASSEGLGEGLEDGYPHRVGSQTFNYDGQKTSDVVKVARTVMLNDDACGGNAG